MTYHLQHTKNLASWPGIYHKDCISTGPCPKSEGFIWTIVFTSILAYKSHNDRPEYVKRTFIIMFSAVLLQNIPTEIVENIFFDCCNTTEDNVFVCCPSRVVLTVKQIWIGLKMYNMSKTC